MPKYPSLLVRVTLNAETQLGPGKAELLQAIDETGSIAAAGRQLGMSYKRAWYLIDTMNRYFREPLVVSTKGGKAGGGAQLTATGRDVVRSFRRIEAATAKAAAKQLSVLMALAAGKRT
jgi:molybdate transport system regulatory protein